MPNSLNNVISGYNNTLYTSLGNVTIPVGIYTGSLLATAIQTVLQALDADFTFTYSTTTYKFTITHADTNFTVNIGSNSANKLIGFSTSANTSSALTHTSSNSIDLSPQKSLLIDIQEAEPTIISTNVQNIRSCLYIPVTEGFGSVVNIDASEVDQIVKFRRTSSLNIKILDVTGNTADLRNLDWELLLSKQ
jgi:hypothetical protein